MISFLKTGGSERIEVLALDDSRDPVTGKTDLLLQIRRISDNWYLDFNDLTFKGSLWTTREQAMSEVDATYDPGQYNYVFNTSTITNRVDPDTYQFRVRQSPGTDVKNVPQAGELKVGYHLDEIDDIHDKLPTNFIMGSSVATDKDDEIDGIKAKTDTLPADPASQAAVITEIDANEAILNDIKSKTDNLPADPSSQTVVLGAISGIDTKIDSMQDDVTFIFNVSGGRWIIDETTNELRLYEADNSTLVATFDLKDINGNPAYLSVFERVRA